VPEIGAPSFGEPPRKESPGETRQRYAGTITEICNALGIHPSEAEKERVAAFVVNVIGQLTPAQQKALSEIVGKVVSWGVQRYMDKK
jgi:hypothetical protein